MELQRDKLAPEDERDNESSYGQKTHGHLNASYKNLKSNEGRYENS